MLRRLLQNSVVLFVLVIILLLIIPLPPALVDVAIVINMAISMMILVITMTIREPLELSIFPSLLLITTLFRLGINVSTTRNILTRGGESGAIIDIEIRNKGKMFLHNIIGLMFKIHNKYQILFDPEHTKWFYILRIHCKNIK